MQSHASIIRLTFLHVTIWLIGLVSLLFGGWQLIKDFDKRLVFENRLKEEKEKLDVTLYSIGEGVITTDEKGHLLLLKDAAQKMTGL